MCVCGCVDGWSSPPVVLQGAQPMLHDCRLPWHVEPTHDPPLTWHRKGTVLSEEDTEVSELWTMLLSWEVNIATAEQFRRHHDIFQRNITLTS